MNPSVWTLGTACALTALLSACGGSDTPPQLRQAQPGSLVSCGTLASGFSHANTAITSASVVAAGTLSNGGAPVGEHCVVSGKMNQRTSSVDGQTYAIGFEMRLPKDWNGRFLYQGNGGTDGVISQAVGNISAGGMLRHALQQGFAVISSDAGHSAAQNPLFGLDPQARLDYGYQAVGTLTPMAKELIKTAYGKGPDRSYFGGCSNGGRHAMIAAARYADQYDGILAGAPGLHLPKAATAQLWKVQQYASIATSTIASGNDAGQPDISSAVTPAEWSVLGKSITAKCDSLDGVSDGIVSDVKACQSTFNINTDVTTCTGARDGTCLSSAQKTVLAKIFAGAKKSNGESTYSNFYFDPGVAGSNYAYWHYTASTQLDPGAVAFIFTTPPSTLGAFLGTTGLKYGLAFNLDTDYQKIFATDTLYTESPWSYMTPPNETELSKLRNRGAKLMVYHGSADGIFSAADTANWYEALQAANGGNAGNFARYFVVPGMNHCSGGPSTDQFDMLSQLVNWVEGVSGAPESVVASARGPGANVVNAEVPASWSPARSRPLCAYPKVARYKGTGDSESASSFSCT